MGQDVGAAGKARDRICGAFEGLFEQRGLIRDVADRLPAGAVFFFELGLGAEVAEVALIDLKGFRQGDRGDFRLASPGVVLRSKRRAGFLPRAVVLWPPSWVIDILGEKGRVSQLTAMKGEEKLTAVP